MSTWSLNRTTNFTDLQNVDSAEQWKSADERDETEIAVKDDTLHGCHRRMLEKQLGCDVKFQLGKEQTKILGAHKYMLSARSEVFFQMFYGSPSHSSVIAIPEIEKDSFMSFLRYVYYDETQIDSQNILHVLYCSRKYQVMPLLHLCDKVVQEKMTVENVCNFLQQAQHYGERDIYEKCLRFIYQHGKNVLKTEQFLQLSRDCVRDIVASDILRCAETTVYVSVIKWASSECKRQLKKITDSNVRVVLGDVLYQIRFVHLEMQYFATNVSNRNFLTDTEKLQLFKIMSGAISPKGPFNCRQRSLGSELRRGGHSMLNIPGSISVRGSAGQARNIGPGVCQVNQPTGPLTHRPIGTLPNSRVASPALVRGFSGRKGGYQTHDVTFQSIFSGFFDTHENIQ